MGPCVPGEREGDLTQQRVADRGERERENERGARERIGRRVAEKEREALQRVWPSDPPLPFSLFLSLVLPYPLPSSSSFHLPTVSLSSVVYPKPRPSSLLENLERRFRLSSRARPLDGSFRRFLSRFLPLASPLVQRGKFSWETKSFSLWNVTGLRLSTLGPGLGTVSFAWERNGPETASVDGGGRVTDMSQTWLEKWGNEWVDSRSVFYVCNRWGIEGGRFVSIFHLFGRWIGGLWNR